VDVRNTGKVAGDQVVQLYLHATVSSVTRPVKELKGFRRVSLAPGETTTVQFTLDREAFSVWDEHMRHVVEPGTFEIMVGPDSVSLEKVTVDVTS
jgi:beta-glucosidase